MRRRRSSSISTAGFGNGFDEVRVYCIVERSTSLDLLKLERKMLRKKVSSIIEHIGTYVCIHKGVISFLTTYSERYLDQYSSDTRVRHGTFRRNVTALGRAEAWD